MLTLRLKLIPSISIVFAMAFAALPAWGDFSSGAGAGSDIPEISLATPAEGLGTLGALGDDSDPVTVISDMILPYNGTPHGDYDSGGKVWDPDYTVWADTFGYDGSTGKEDLRADSNGNGWVDVADYTTWADNYGKEYMPEPATLTLLAAGAMAFLRRRTARA